MRVAVETSQVIIKTYLVDVPDETPNERLFDEVDKVRGQLVHEPDWDTTGSAASLDAVFLLNEDGDPEDEPAWPLSLDKIEGSDIEI
jgi:hypothetical protein